LYQFVETLLRAGVLREVSIGEDDPAVYNRTLCLAREAHARGLEMNSLELNGQSTNFFSMIVNGRRRLFDGLPCYEVDHRFPVEVDDKENLRRLLLENGLPAPEGRAFCREKDAIAYAPSIGFPLVVKPRAGSLSRHTTCGVEGEAVLRSAIRLARELSDEFVVERFVPGEVFRATLVDGTLVAVCLRERPNVVGDGVHTIEELIAIKNEDPRRGPSSQKNRTLHHIQLTPASHELLAAQGVLLRSTPSAGQKVYLHAKVILACGADIHDVTDSVHSDARALLERAAKLCQAPVVGFDLICEDIARAPTEQSFAVIEANTLPYIDMHHVPTTGEPRNVAGAIMDFVMRTTPAG
jgi:D-alanine-D-alanine ligase-like ATP-grasp enzyme